jgi:hypothetical protein
MFIFPILILLAVAMIGCQFSDPSSEEQVDAETVAWLITDPANGLTQEVADLSSYLFGVDGSVQNVAPQDSTVESKAFGVSASYAIYCSGSLGGFTWNPLTQAYEKELIDVDILLPHREVHLERLFVQVRFYTSFDASGDPYQPQNVDGGLDPAVHSLTYYREVKGSATNLNTGTDSAFDAVSDLVYSDIDMDAKSVTINGTHNREFERLFANGRMVNGEVSYTIKALDIAYDEETSTFTYSGEIDYVYDAAVTRADGTIVVRHREATISFDGTTTFLVLVGKLRFRFNLLTGALIG